MRIFNSHGLEAVDKKKQTSFGALVPDLFCLLFLLRGLKLPDGIMFDIFYTGLKAGAIE
jgi:hypothetical protein